jgi:hypothetical protein
MPALMHPYLTAVRRACCAWGAYYHRELTILVTYSSIVAAAAKQTPIAFFLNPKQTRPLSAGPLFIVCHYSNFNFHFHSTSPQFFSPPLVSSVHPVLEGSKAHLRSLLARGH